MTEDFKSTPTWQSAPLLSIMYPAHGHDNSSQWSPEALEDVHFVQEIQHNSTNFQNLSRTECISTYSAQFLSTKRNVILVASNKSSITTTFIVLTRFTPTLMGDQDWMCNQEYETDGQCRDALSRDPTNVDDWDPFGIPIKYCLSETVPEACSLQCSLVLLWIVIFCNLCKTLIMFFVAFKLIWRPLITVGDGVASFLAEPDETTKGACLVTAKIAQRTNWTNRMYPFMWMPKRNRGFETASCRRWLFCNAL